jgi:hypothetical protein
VTEVRKLMKDTRVKKDPGCSWTEIKNNIYLYLVGEKLQPQIEEIYAELGRLTKLCA